MVTVQIVLPDRVAAAAIAAAIDAGISFDAFIERSLSSALVPASDTACATTAGVLTAEHLFAAALLRAEDQPYRLEELYRGAAPAVAWTRLPAGRRISLGRAFRKLVDAQAADGKPAGNATHVIELVGTSSQNQAIYRTRAAGRRPT